MNAPRWRKQAGPRDAAQDPRRPNALAVTSLVLAALALGIVGWLAVSGPVERPDRSPAVMLNRAPTAEAAGPGPDAETAGAAHDHDVAALGSERSDGSVVPRAGPPGPALETARVEKTGLGSLLRPAPDARPPWRAHARPFSEDGRRPRIAVIVASLGLSSDATEAAIRRLPGPVTLSFAPYARDLDRWVGLARADGHEVMLDLPMEPVTFPHDHLRPHTLLTSLSEDANMDRLRWILGRATGYVGMVNQMGSRFTTSEAHVRPILSELQRRGLLFVDSRASPDSVAARLAWEIGLPRAANNRFIDAEPSPEAIDARLQELERISGDTGRAVGIGSPFAVTIDRLAHWAAGLGARGRTLAPVSALVETEGN